jgi:hypothetical protein
MPDAIQPTTFAIHVGATIFFVLANGFFVAAEFALAKVRLNEFDALADAGDSRAKLGLRHRAARPPATARRRGGDRPVSGVGDRGPAQSRRLAPLPQSYG